MIKYKYTRSAGVEKMLTKVFIKKDKSTGRYSHPHTVFIPGKDATLIEFPRCIWCRIIHCVPPKIADNNRKMLEKNPKRFF